jgi:hypothetical protein
MSLELGNHATDCRELIPHRLNGSESTTQAGGLAPAMGSPDARMMLTINLRAAPILGWFNGRIAPSDKLCAARSTIEVR